MCYEVGEYVGFDGESEEESEEEKELEFKEEFIYDEMEEE